MIYLLEGDSFVEIDDWLKISSRPKYLDNLLVGSRKLEKIIGYYELGEKVKCGLSTCHTPHFKGYVVETDDGIELNIGHTCGTKYFDVQFDTMSSEFLNALELAQAKLSIMESKKHLFQYWSDVNALAVGPKNITWAINLHNKISNPDVVGMAAYLALRRMLANNNGNVTTERPATADEIEFARAAGHPIPQSVEIVIGSIANIECMSPINNPVVAYETQLRGAVQALQDADPEKLSRTQMRPIVAGISSLKTRISTAMRVIEIARLFYTRENLSQLLLSLENNENISKADVNLYKEFLDSI